MMKKFFLGILLIVSVSFVQAKGVLERVATSHYQWTGIAISKEDRIFVCYPTWDVASPFKVAELRNGKEVAYPDIETNQKFVCVQSVYVDAMNRLWILDPANPRFNGVISSGAKLFVVDLANNKIIQTYKIPRTVAPSGSYLNDLRVDVSRGYVYITDSELGGIVVLKLSDGTSWRALDHTVPQVMSNLDGINFINTGFWKSKANTDGIELSKDGEWLYFSNLCGTKLYKVPTEALRNQNTSMQEKAKFITLLNDKNVPSDGMWLKGNTLIMANLPHEALWKFDLQTNKARSISMNKKFRWADSFAEDSKGNIYFTCSQINYPKEKRKEYLIYKFRIH